MLNNSILIAEIIRSGLQIKNRGYHWMLSLDVLLETIIIIMILHYSILTKIGY